MQIARDPGRINVGRNERILCALAGGLTGLVAARRRGLLGPPLLALGSYLLNRGINGHCALYDLLEITTAGPHHPRASVDATYAVRVDRSITVAAPREMTYLYWRDFESFPSFMQHVRAVKSMDAMRSHWVVDGPFGRALEWDAEIVNEEPGERIGWRSLPGSDVAHAGSVRFHAAPGGRGTVVEVTVEYHAPAGIIGKWLARLAGDDPKRHIHEDLRRFKQLIETGEVARTVGQARGGRTYQPTLQPEEARVP